MRKIIKRFVIQFDAQHKFFDQQRGPNDEFGFARSVQYVNDRPQINFMNTSGEEIFLTKSKHWEYEQEWRILMPFSLATKKIQTDEACIYLYDLPVDCITGLVFGSRISPNDNKMFSDLVKTDTRYSHVKLMQVRLDEKVFGIEILPVQ